MAWEGRLWVKLRRPLTDEEKSRQLKVDIPASEKAQDDYSIFEMNDTWLETTNAAYQQRGMLTYGCIFILAMGMIIVGVAVWALTNPPPNTSGTELMVAMAFVVVFMLLGFGIILVSLWGFLQELFTWTRIPIRFNRQTRMVHAYRGGGRRVSFRSPGTRHSFSSSSALKTRFPEVRRTGCAVTCSMTRGV